MPCYHPVDAWVTSAGLVFACPGDGKPVPADLQVPCGRCIGCRLRRSAEWADRCMHEKRVSDDSAFLTLTFDDEHLPPDGSLDHGYFQRFIRAARQQLKCKLRYFMCGEYGPELGRPHYHAAVFGYRWPQRTLWCKSDSGESVYRTAELDKLWPHGIATVQDLTWQSASYVSRYVLDKVTGDLAESHYGGKRPEYCRMSLRPGIGAEWFKRYGSDLRHDYVVRNGREAQVPRYYDKLLKRDDAVELAERKEKRVESSRSRQLDNTPERLAVKEQVQHARVANLKRRER